MNNFPRLRWLLLLQIAVIAGSVDSGNILEGIQSVRVLAPAIVSLVLFSLRLARAFQSIDNDDFVHTMDGRTVKPGLWNRVW